ncbi:YihY/virulence factor BrkB family protein [Paracoccus liaowanqingii]|uniref:YihY/virulence factor BrkB family protein n=1 Tax=Paracoccus liaowanqingii TaxID=2560053 RepID=A0A4Z1CAA4_9RHOB|nr:YihY/virulence factor BrkB family protein [Paracoccus liaowanqingii]TGN59394.1 YihY/virulence factor BrkB family protein [Paracoccus liaowanqingii]
MQQDTGVLGALLGPLDPETRQKYGLEAPDASKSPLPEPAATGPKPGLRDLTRSDLLAVGKSVFNQIGEDRVTSVAGGVTFFGLLSLFPAITAFVSLYGLMADPSTIQSHLQMLRTLLPEGSFQIINDQVTAIASASTGALSLAGIVALLTAFWSANGGMKALLSALNVAFFQRETRSFLRLNVVAMCFTLGGLVMIALMLIVIAVVPVLLRMLPLGWGGETLVAVIRWPIMLAVLIVALATVYRWGPAAPKSRWRWISPGAIFAGVALVVTSMLFSWYAANFGDYNETYGSLGAVIALMTWLWLNATIVLVGAEINSELEGHLKHMAGLEDDRPQKRGPKPQ